MVERAIRELATRFKTPYAKWETLLSSYLAFWLAAELHFFPWSQPCCATISSELCSPLLPSSQPRRSSQQQAHRPPEAKTASMQPRRATEDCLTDTGMAPQTFGIQPLKSGARTTRRTTPESFGSLTATWSCTTRQCRVALPFGPRTPTAVVLASTSNETGTS